MPTTFTSTTPWHARVRRWGQTNLTENDPLTYDVEFWRRRWRDSNTQGIIVNAGGIVAFYPSAFPHHYRAAHLGDRDLLGEIITAAREDGLAVLARMDSNRVSAAFYSEHTDWFVANAHGQPIHTDQHPIQHFACVNSPYTTDYLPALFREIYQRYQPDGFADNSWTGLGRQTFCHCPHCRAKFTRDTSLPDLPVAPDWDSPLYRRWIRWSYDCRLELWDRHNTVTRALGGPDCLWLGMMHSEPHGGHVNFADLARLGPRTPIILTDQQSRNEHGFENNSHAGKLLHEVSSWDTAIPESMALYPRGTGAKTLSARLSACPPVEANHWMRSGIAGGITPWWHIVGAGTDDRRRLATADPLLAWHTANEDVLFNREPVATFGLLWSHEHSDFYGRDEPALRVVAPYRGWTHALTRARYPWLPVHADAIAAQSGRLQTLILPDFAVLSDSQIAALHTFVHNRGSLIITGRPGTLDETGAPRTAPNPTLDALLGLTYTGRQFGPADPDYVPVSAANSYLRLDPDPSARHPILSGFDETDILSFAGTLHEVTLDSPRISDRISDTHILATLVPEFPGYPPEFSWMPVPRTEIPALLIRETGYGGRIVVIPSDLDALCHQRRLPDHAQLLTQAAAWTANDQLPFKLEGHGQFDCHLYRQSGRLIFQIINLTGTQGWPGYQEHIPPVGPLALTLRASSGKPITRITSRVSGESLAFQKIGDTLVITLPVLQEHDLLVIE